MAVHQVNLATIDKMIHTSKASIFLIWNLSNFHWGLHAFCWMRNIGPLSWLKIKTLLILWLRAF